MLTYRRPGRVAWVRISRHKRGRHRTCQPSAVSSGLSPSAFSFQLSGRAPLGLADSWSL